MMFCLILALLILNVDAKNTLKEEKTINVKTFYDYKVEMANVNDVLNIFIPQNTFLFISAIDGYTATVYNSAIQNDSNILKKLLPDEINRLIYFKNEGSLKVISKNSSYIFTFHALPIDMIKGLSDISFDLIVFNNINENFYLSNSFEDHKKPYFRKSVIQCYTLIWSISNEYTERRLNGNANYTKSQYDEFNENLIIMEQNERTEFLYASSLIYLINEDVSDEFEIRLLGIDNSIEYRAYVKQSEFSTTNVIERGKYFLSEPLNYDKLNDGIITLDFSLSKDKMFNLRNTILILPMKTSVYAENYEIEDEIFGTYFGQDNGYLTLKANVDHISEIETKIKIISLPINSDIVSYEYGHLETIVSTSPTEYLKIGSYFDEESNYSCDSESYCYVMASLQDIETTIVYNGSLEIYLIIDNKLNKTKINSGDTIFGPFVASIDRNTFCEFKTSPRYNLKKDYNDNSQIYFKYGAAFSLMSNKYGLYKVEKLFAISNFYPINMDNVNSVKIVTSSIVYIHNKYGWKGEICNENLTIQEREFGPHLNKTAFYVPKDNINDQKCTFLIHKLHFDEEFKLVITSQYLRFSLGFGEKFVCDKYFITSIYPSLYKITTKLDDADGIIINSNETLCILPTFADIYYGYSISNNGSDASVYYIEKDLHFPIDRGPLTNDTYKEVTEYKYLRGTGTLIIESNNTELNAYLAFQNLLNTISNIFPYVYEPKFISQFWINYKSNITFIENQFKHVNDPEECEDDVFVITKKIGIKSVDMTQKETFIIKCPINACILIHNVDEIDVDAYGEGELFGSINSTSPNGIINFGQSEGEIHIKKRNSSFSYSKSMHANDLKIYFSYMTLFYRDVYICNYPHKNIKTVLGNHDEDYLLSQGYNFTCDKDYGCYLWFTSPLEFELSYVNHLPGHLAIADSESFLNHYLQSDTVKGKSFFFKTSTWPLYDQDLLRYRFIQFNMSLSNDDDETKIDKFDIFNENFEINMRHSNEIILRRADKFTPTPTTKNEPRSSDDNNILYIILLVVGIVVIIIIIVIIVVCVKKKKRQRIINMDQSP